MVAKATQSVLPQYRKSLLLARLFQNSYNIVAAARDCLGKENAWKIFESLFLPK